MVPFCPCPNAKLNARLHLLPSHPYSYGPALTPPRPKYSPTKLLLGFQGFQALCRAPIPTPAWQHCSLATDACDVPASLCLWVFLGLCTGLALLRAVLGTRGSAQGPRAHMKLCWCRSAAPSILAVGAAVDKKVNNLISPREAAARHSAPLILSFWLRRGNDGVTPEQQGALSI